MFDSKADGTITTKDLGTLMRQLGKSPTEAELQSLVSRADNTGRYNL